MSDDWERRKELAIERARERERDRAEKKARAEERAREREMIRRQRAREDAGIVRQNGTLVDMRGIHPMSRLYSRPVLTKGMQHPNELDPIEESYPTRKVVCPKEPSRKTFHAWQDRLPADSPYKPGDPASAEQYIADLFARLDSEASSDDAPSDCASGETPEQATEGKEF